MLHLPSGAGDVGRAHFAVADPLIAPHWPNRLIHMVALMAIALGAGYLGWRIIASREGATQWMFWLLIAAEVFGWLSLILHAQEAWRVEPARRRPALDLTVDILVPTYDEGAVILEATLVGCSQVRGRTTVWVLDDGRRDWVRELAESFGFQYVTREGNAHAKAGNVNAALKRLTGELILILDADHVPSPEIVEAMSGYFADPTLAIVQSPHFFRNRDSAQHSSMESHEQGLFFEVLMPGRDHLDAVFWCGSGAILRSEALRSIGGLSTSTIAEDFETTLKLHAAGYGARYHHEHLLQGLAPHNLAAYVLQRDRWCRGTLQALFMKFSPLRARGWRFRTRAAYMSNLFYYILPIQRMVFALLLIVTLLSGWLPVGQIPLAMLGGWALWTVAAQAGAWGLSRGQQRPTEGDIGTWVTAGPYLNAWLMVLTRRRIPFRVTPKEGVDEGGRAALQLLKLPLALLLITIAALGVRLAAQAIGAANGYWVLPPIDTEVMIVLTFFALWEIFTLARTLRRYTKRRQYRMLWRFPVDLDATVGGVSARVVDLHEVGARVHVPTRSKIPEVAPIRVAVHDASGKLLNAHGMLTTRSVTVDDTGKMMIGGSCEWNSVEDRRRVIFETHVYASLMATKALEAKAI